MKRNIIFPVLIVLFWTMAPLWVCAEAPPTWSDEFDGSGPPDPAIWTFEQGFVRNEELQWYTNNATQAGGVLVIEARREQVLNPNYDAGSTSWKLNREYAEYTSASIVSAGKYSFQYGRMQVRAKIPCFTGSWPAIWTLGNVGEWPSNGECDILEYYLVGGVPAILANLARGTTTRWSAAWDSVSKPVSQLTAVDPAWKTANHVWTMQWDQENVRLYVDSILMNTIPQSWIVNPVTTWGPQYPFKQPQYILLNLAIGGAGGDPSSTTFPLHYEIDYVRVWEGATNNVAPTDIALTASSVGENLSAGTVVGNLSATDADPGEVISYSLVTGTGSTNNNQFQISFLSGETKTSVLKTAAVLSYAEGATRSIRVRATDIEGATYDKVLTINVLGGEAVEASTGTISVPEGGTNTFNVRLRVVPANTVTVNVARVSGDADLSVNSGSVLYFTPANGTNWQPVVLAAAEDVERTNGMAIFVCSDPGGVFVSANVNAYEVDNDNSAPIFTVDPISKADATQSVAYAGSIAGAATDADSDPLTYSKVSGPAWLTVSAGGGLSGTPSGLDIGNNSWTVRVADSNGGLDTAILNIAVVLNGSQIVLVGGNVRNGNFNTPIQATNTFAQLNNWFNLGSSGQSVAATKSAAGNMYDSTQYAEIGYLPGTKIFALDTEHTLAEGDVFDVGYVWRDGWLWNNTSHRVAVSLFVTSDNTTNGTQTVLVTDNSSLNATLNSYEAVNHDGIYTASNSVAGKRLFVKIDTTISSEAYAFLDNFELILTPAVPGIVDNDSDGMDDNWEIANFDDIGGSNGTGDQDGDGFLDLHEYLAGTSPTNSSSLLILESASAVVAGSQIVLTWAGVAGRTYQLLSSTNLMQPVWETNITGINGVSPTTAVTNTVSEPGCYYLIKLE